MRFLVAIGLDGDLGTVAHGTIDDSGVVWVGDGKRATGARDRISTTRHGVVEHV